MAPALVFVAAFLLLPVAFNVYASFTQWQKFSGLDRMAGFANYTRLFSNPNFETAGFNTMPSDSCSTLARKISCQGV